jgi:hypothetical protein
MNTLPAATSGDENPAAPHGLSAESQRAAVREFLAAQRRQWDEAESQLRGQVEQLQGDFQARQAQLEAQRREVAAFQAESEHRRRIIARQLKARHAKNLAELERLRSEAAQQRGAGWLELEEQLQTARYCEKQLAAEVESLQATCEQLRQELARRGAEKAPRSAGEPSAGGVSSWEEEKRRILAALESETDGNQSSVAERLKVTEVVGATDRIVADLERQLAQLQGLLASQSGSPAPPVMGAAALGELIDNDSVVREERQSLRRLQEEWREKLRQAEIDISQERAQIARQRAELEKKRHSLEADADGAKVENLLPAKPAGGRWLARLGLKDKEEG